MIQNCDKIADQLRDLSKKLSKRPEARSRTADNFRLAINFMVKKKEIDDLRERLMALDSMIKSYIRKALQR